LPAIGIEVGSHAGKAVSRRVGEIFKTKYMSQLEPFHGTRDLLLHMKRLGLSLSVASSSSAEMLHDLLRLATIADLIDARSDSSDADASKPDPDILQNAIARSGLAPEQLVMIGDTPYDVEAAHRARVSAIVLRCGGWWSDADYGIDVEIFEDPAHLLAEFDRSSIARRRAHDAR
jgi:beta-phosphoglucomutase-like phosphatase (HAD superfamily)